MESHEDLVEKCERAVARSRQNSAVLSWRVAGEAGVIGDGATAASSLAGLDPGVRFAATVVLGLAFPAVLVATATAYEQEVDSADGDADWSRWCSYETVRRWAGQSTGLPVQTVRRICELANPLARGSALLAAVRSRIATGELDDARYLAEGIAAYAKQDRAVAYALLAVAAGDPADAKEAVRSAAASPVIENGGEEAEALAAVLAVYAGADRAEDDPWVIAAAERLCRWAQRRWSGRDTRSYCVAAAARTCLAASWPGLARTLADCVYHPDQRQALDAEFAAGTPAHEPEPKVWEPTVTEICDSVHMQSRMTAATQRAVVRLDAGDTTDALGAVEAALSGVLVRSDAEIGRDRASWAVALARGGFNELAAAELDDLRFWPQPVWTAAALLPPELIHAWVARAVDGQVSPDQTARLVARLNDPELERQHLTALLAATGGTAEYRRERIEQAARVYAASSPERFDSLIEGVSDDERQLLAPARAIALAHRGEVLDAIATAKTCAPDTAHRTMVDIAQRTANPAVLAAFRRAKRDGRGSRAQELRQFRLGQVALACGEIDAAIEALGGLSGLGIPGVRGGELVGQIAEQLTATDSWTAERAEALAGLLANHAAVLYRDLPETLVTAGPLIVAHHRRDGDVFAEVRARLPEVGAGLRGLIDLVVQIGIGLTGETIHTATVEAAVDEAVAHWTERTTGSQAVVAAVAALPRELRGRDTLLEKAVGLLATGDPRELKAAQDTMLSRLDPRDGTIVAAALAGLDLPEKVRRAVDDRLGEFIADRADDAAGFPIEHAADPATTATRVRQAARYLVRHGDLAAAERIRAAVGEG